MVNGAAEQPKQASMIRPVPKWTEILVSEDILIPVDADASTVLRRYGTAQRQILPPDQGLD